MLLSQKIEQLIAFDIKDLDTENMGSWPMMIKSIIGMVVFIGVSAAGIFFSCHRFATTISQVWSTRASA